MTKQNELAANARGEGCLGRSEENEPVFILVGRDRLAAAVVRVWAGMFRAVRVALGSYDKRAQSKYLDAIALADDMDLWRATHDNGKIPD